MKKHILIGMAILWVGCAGNRPMERLPLELPIGSQMKVIHINTSQFPRITAKVIIKNNQNQPVINLAPPYGHVKDWQRIWRPLVEQHPLFQTGPLTNFSVVEIQPEVKLPDTAPGKPKPLLPAAVVLVIDVSGSMSGEPLAKAKEAALMFVDNADVEIALIAFDDEVYFKNDFTYDKTSLKNSITGLQSGGGTHLYNALFDAIQLLKSKRGDRHIIALTDGATSGDRYSLEQIINLANSGDVNISAETGTGSKIFTVGLRYEGGNLRTLAEQTGGQYWYVAKPEDLPNLFSQLSEEMLAKFYYLISYRTTFVIEDGTNRTFSFDILDNALNGNYTAPLSKARFHLSGRIWDRDTHEKVPAAKVTIRPQDSDSATSAVADENGHYELLAKRTAGKYSVFVEGPEHFIAVMDTFLCPPDKYYSQKDFQLEKIKIGSTVAMRMIHFETNEFLFEPVSLPDLMVMGEYFVKHPQLKFEVSGHTDSYGNADYNLWLSEKRAESVADFFISLGVPESNITVRGYGESRMLVPDYSAEDRYQNRRVEIKVLEMDNRK
ncbi:MAG: VWA domain-containing protein [candidate division KSB1 bacterium]|nr:VWA domain-containing protein [candidate division KSB1 bacterium]MDZ7317581.1 VWA domain-containing protein [candidate division KSB1 bacterium]MDZ7340188.1 VWA domain-containing protein [candidate division KSB1 bacterium]